MEEMFTWLGGAEEDRREKGNVKDTQVSVVSPIQRTMS